MREKRLLLPFTFGVNGKAIDDVLLFAKATHATLVALSLITVPGQQSGARLEYIQQSQDFLEMIHAKASSFEVPLERHELFTQNVHKSILLSVSTMNCDGIILVFEGEATHFLNSCEAQQIQQSTQYPLYILHHVQKKSKPVWQRLLSPHSARL